MMFIEAMRAWQEAAGGIPARITALIEGEEEVGSPNLEPFLAANKSELAADLALISDTGMWDVDTPAITTRLRGMTYVQVTLKAANRDLHSGLYGGSALNPINALARVLGDLHDANGRIQLPGFYDKVKPVSNAQRAQWDALGFDEDAFLGKIGLEAPVGERGYSALERLWARPTADINGMWGGYTGVGSKTVIASEASAKISFRLVPDQDPDEVFEQFKRFVSERLPPGATVAYRSGHALAGHRGEHGKPLGACRADGARRGIRQAGGADGQRRLDPGGDIAAQVLGIDSLLMGFGLDDDQVHSPNEKFEQRCFHHGIRSHITAAGEVRRRIAVIVGAVRESSPRPPSPSRKGGGVLSRAPPPHHRPAESSRGSVRPRAECRGMPRDHRTVRLRQEPVPAHGRRSRPEPGRGVSRRRRAPVADRRPHGAARWSTAPPSPVGGTKGSPTISTRQLWTSPVPPRHGSRSPPRCWTDRWCSSPPASGSAWR